MLCVCLKRILGGPRCDRDESGSDDFVFTSESSEDEGSTDEGVEGANGLLKKGTRANMIKMLICKQSSGKHA